MNKDTIDKNTVLFMQLVLTFQSAAMQQMGKIANPLTGKIERHLEQASHSIDTIDMLCTKCKGNLTKDEEMFITHVVSELKLNYVDECRKPDTSQDEASKEASSEDTTAESKTSGVTEDNPD